MKREKWTAGKDSSVGKGIVMQANYHTHTRWCRHGVGEIEEYIEEAIRCGFKELAITEHVPHKNIAESWIPWEQFPAYDEALNHAVSTYQGQIHIIKGFECEYYPVEMEVYRELQEDYGYELLILGQHCCGKNREIDVFARKGARELQIYADEVCEGLETGMFRFLAHPDCVLHKYENSWDAECVSAMRRIFRTCERLKIPVEINANGIRGNRRYPSREAFLLSREYDLQYLINSDAHAPQFVYDEACRNAEQFAKELGIRVAERLG